MSKHSLTSLLFYTSEFASLIDRLVESYAEILRQLLDTGLSMPRSELDRGANSDKVWNKLIADKFNDTF